MKRRSIYFVLVKKFKKINKKSKIKNDKKLGYEI